MGMFNVKDMYGYSNTHHTPLLSNLNKDWWQEYVNNYNEFDNVFRSLYKSFRYYDQEWDEELPNVTAHFTQDVKDWLLVNDKRFSELWRVNVVDDEEYGILDNYNLRETYAGTDTAQGTSTEGARIDSKTGNEHSQGLDTIQSASKEGARTDVRDFTEGSQNAENQNRISAFNVNDMASKNTVKSSTGTRNDVEEFTKGELDNTYASNEGTELNKTNSESFTKGAMDNTFNNSGANQHTLHRYGNIGVRTQTEVMEKHTDYWKSYNFYMFIFSEIQKQFLLV